MRVSVATRVYRVLLRVAPQRLRDTHAGEMEALFTDALSEAEPSGRRALLRVWASAAWDLVKARAREPFRGRSKRGGSEPERKPIMFGSDLRYTVRWLVRQRLSTALVVAMLSLGIAANVVVFSLVNGLFFRPFPFPDSERLVYVNTTAPRWNLDVVGINYPDFHHWRQNLQLFDGIAIWDDATFNLSEGGSAERIEGARVTHDFASVLRINPVFGRMFTADEDKPGAPPVVVIGEGLWRERFARSPDVLGKTLKLDGVTRTIVGVMPPAAEFPGNVRLWTPLAGDPAQPWQNYGYAGAIGRLVPGVSVQDGEKDLLRAQQGVWDARDKERIVSPYARPLRSEFARNFRTQARTLTAAVAILLIVACANVASVMLARALARRREMGIRLAVGASRGRLARQLFAENMALSILGGAIGLATGHWALRALIAGAGDQIPSWATFAFDWRVAAFTVAVTVMTTLLFGLAPSLHAIRGNLRAAVHDTTAGTTASPGGRRTLSVLVGAEFALAAVLLVCGGLLLRAYGRVQQVDPGFRPDHVLTFALALPDAAYGDSPKTPPEEQGQKQRAFWTRLVERLRSLPGVEQAGLVSCPPLSCHWGTFYDVEGRAPLAPGEPNPVTLYRPATPGYFPAMGIRLETGRFFDDRDGAGGNRVIIVNETFVKTFWPGVTDPVGRRVGRARANRWMTVVGVVEDVKHYGLEKPMRPGVYIPVQQEPASTLTVAIRTAGDPAAFTATARTAVRELDADLAMYRIRTMEQSISESLTQRRLYSWLIGVFAVMSLVLALGGTYGVASYLVSQRTREIGIRVALGARSADITRAVLRSGLSTIGAGVLIGASVAVAIARLIADLLFGVKPHDPAILGGAAALLLAFAAGANWFPARRAARVDPMRSLRAE
jgi:putative ABC transport system permease protein